MRTKTVSDQDSQLSVRTIVTIVTFNAQGAGRSWVRTTKYGWWRGT